jgi:hypothetical protein
LPDGSVVFDCDSKLKIQNSLPGGSVVIRMVIQDSKFFARRFGGNSNCDENCNAAAGAGRYLIQNSEFFARRFGGIRL